MTARAARLARFLLPVLMLAAIRCSTAPGEPGAVLDEATQAGRSEATLPAADEDYFHDMDGGIALTPDEVKGRDTWLVWSGGNDRFWDHITVNAVGSFDLLKVLSSHPSLKFSRDNRWRWFGLVNEPCFEKATGPDPEHFGLWIDRRRADCPPDPFANEAKYPGIRIGARGRTVPVGSYYGAPTGIVGLRLFPNPDFDEKAARAWDPQRFYTDPGYYQRKDLVRPYRVGMTCAFCHVGPNPTKPPADPEHPEWRNLSANVGSQYFWIDRIITWEANESSFVYQLVHTSRPGSLDTSLVSTDNINNPRTMNAVYQLGPRLEVAKRFGRERLAGGNLENRQFNDFVASGPLTQFFEKPDTVWTPHVLKDGADSVGALGALNRVYLNIGLFSEEWLLHFNPLVGGKPISPIEIAAARHNSSSWRATELQTPATALFFLKSSAPHRLKDAPGGIGYLSTDPAVLRRGKIAFAENCARCHSSKGPALPAGADPGACIGPHYLECWNAYWSWTKTEDFKSQMRRIVLADDFLDGNFLSNDMRVPVTLLQTNACSPLATNGIAGNIWDEFTSASYKELPPVGTITVYDPFTGAPRPFNMPAGGRGYTRVPSLVSLWSTAPFLLNNSIGRFNPSPSVEARMASFQDATEKLLWPERREKDAVLGDKVPGVIDRTTATSYLWVPAGYLPDLLKPLLPALHAKFPAIVGENEISIGPIPAGTPVGLLANLNMLPETTNLRERFEHDREVLRLLVEGLLAARTRPNSDEEARRVFAGLVEPLLALSKCPDFVVNRGHYFGSGYGGREGLSDADKRALIEFLKTF